MNNRLYVENLPASATESSLLALFSQKGPVTEVKLVLDAVTGRSRGRAFVTLATPEIAETALKSFHGHVWDGRNIAVTEARPPVEHTTGLIGHGFEAGIGNNQHQHPHGGNGNGKKAGGRNNNQRRSSPRRSGRGR